MQRPQPPRPSADPVGERRAVEVDPLAGIDLGLPVERKVVGVLGDDDLGDQGLRRQAAFDQPGRGWRLHHRAGAGPAGILGPADYQDPELGRHHIEPFGDVLTDPVHLTGTARAGRVGDVDHRLDPWQVRGQGPAVDPAARAAPAWHGRAVCLGLDGSIACSTSSSASANWSGSSRSERRPKRWRCSSRMIAGNRSRSLSTRAISSA